MRAKPLLLWLWLPLALVLPRLTWAGENNLLSGYSLTSWVEGDGRPLGSVYSMAQDRDGYLWVGSDAGLLRFDGSSFTPWNTLSETPLPTVAVRALCMTRRGTLLVGLAEGAGIREVRDGALTDITYKGLPNQDITDLVEDHDGVVWLVSGRVLYRLRDELWQKVDLPWPNREGLVLQPYVSRNGDLLVSTRWGVFRRSAKTNTFEQLSPEYVWAVTEDNLGTVWTTDIVAGYRRLGARSAPQHEFEGAGYRVMHDRRGNLWVATFGKGLWRVPDSRTQTPPIIEVASLRTGLSSDSVQSVLEDRDGNIWAGTTGGLHRLKVRTLTPVQNVGFVVAMESSNGSDMWAGTTNGIIRFSTPSSWVRAGGNSLGPDVRSLYREDGGTLWVGASEGLWRLRGSRLTHVMLEGLPHIVILSIAPDAGSGLWLGDGDWLFHWDGARVHPLHLPEPFADLGRITFARADHRRRVWLGFSSGRIGILDRDRSLTFIDSPAGGNAVRATLHTMLEDREGTVWLGGSAGLNRIEEGHISTLTRSSGLPLDEVRAMVEDLDGRLWLSVDRGLVRIERDELTRAFADRSYRPNYRWYDAQDGLAGAQVGIIGASRGGDGTLWFVRGGGVTVVDPRSLNRSPEPAPPVLRIESVLAHDDPSNPQILASFPAGTTRLQIRYTALTLSSSNRVRFQYRLDGVDTTWIDAGTRRTAFYANLSPGTYRFHVAMDASGEENVSGVQPAVWSFTIQPAFYQTRGFVAMGLATLFLMIWGAWQGRLRMVRRRFSLALAERARLSREIHDTLLQSLVGVTLQFDAIADGLGRSNTATREELISARRDVEEYIREARQSISDLRSPLLEASDLMSVLKEFGKRTVGSSGVRFVTSVVGTPRQHSPRIDNELLRIGQEAIVNASRHAKPSRIHLEVRFEKGAVVLRVSDDGHGFEYSSSGADSAQHYGLTTMRERAEGIGGQFSVVSSAHAGTVVETVVPTPAARARRKP